MRHVLSWEKIAKKEGKKEGIKEGKKEGIEEGKKEGIKEGIKEGKLQALRNVALKLLQKGTSIETIIEYTDLSRNEIEKLAVTVR